jgi:hypothetical protein
MNENKWFCERCGNEFDLEAGEGWVRLVEEEQSLADGKFVPVMPFETVCYNCADDLYAIVEKCDKRCHNCEATIVWGLSIKDCLKFQLKFDLIELPRRPQPPKGSIEEARQILEIFSRF